MRHSVGFRTAVITLTVAVVVLATCDWAAGARLSASGARTGRKAFIWKAIKGALSPSSPKPSLSPRDDCVRGCVDAMNESRTQWAHKFKANVCPLVLADELYRLDDYKFWYRNPTYKHCMPTDEEGSQVKVDFSACAKQMERYCPKKAATASDGDDCAGLCVDYFRRLSKEDPNVFRTKTCPAARGDLEVWVHADLKFWRQRPDCYSTESAARRSLKSCKADVNKLC
eukprot:GFYU01003705.1.p1 GENE.GFYU01003705.1~~GFYU01003705.1.p1  ORF type:complete len:227 (+),score=21.67 GFYU01003705.1:86-766(+)